MGLLKQHSKEQEEREKNEYDDEVKVERSSEVKRKAQSSKVSRNKAQANNRWRGRIRGVGRRPGSNPGSNQRQTRPEQISAAGTDQQSRRTMNDGKR